MRRLLFETYILKRAVRFLIHPKQAVLSVKYSVGSSFQFKSFSIEAAANAPDSAAISSARGIDISPLSSHDLGDRRALPVTNDTSMLPEAPMTFR